MIKKLLAALGILLTTSASHAAIIEADLHSSGDGLLIRDTTNNLEWADWSHAPNPVSVDAFFSTGPFAGQGFRLATKSEVEQLFISAGADAISYNGSWIQTAANAAAINLLNSTTNHHHPYPDTSGNPWIHAMFDNEDGNPNRSGFVRFNSTSFGGNGVIDIYSNAHLDNHYAHHDAWSVLAVRDIVNVSEPTNLALLGFFFAGIISLRRRQLSL